MSRSLRSIKNQYLRYDAIQKRIAKETKGLGYWAAVDASNNPETMYQIRQQIKADLKTENAVKAELDEHMQNL